MVFLFWFSFALLLSFFVYLFVCLFGFIWFGFALLLGFFYFFGFVLFCFVMFGWGCLFVSLKLRKRADFHD